MKHLFFFHSFPLLDGAKEKLRSEIVARDYESNEILKVPACRSDRCASVISFLSTIQTVLICQTHVVELFPTAFWFGIFGSHVAGAIIQPFR